MALAFELPDSAKVVFRQIASMPDAQFARIAGYVRDLPQEPVLSATIDRLERGLPAKDRPAFRDVINELARLARTAESSELSEDDTVETVMAQVETDEPSRRVLQDRLRGLLGEKSIQLHARAWSLLYDEERYITGCRLITDIRPIFDEAGRQANNFIIVNHLHLKYMQNQRVRDVFFALDEDDIAVLSSLASRAKQKIQFLKKINLTAAPENEKAK